MENVGGWKDVWLLGSNWAYRSEKEESPDHTIGYVYVLYIWGLREKVSTCKKIQHKENQKGFSFFSEFSNKKLFVVNNVSLLWYYS